MQIPSKVKVLKCVGPLTGKASGNTFYLVQAETPNDQGGWSSIRWTAVSEKPIAVGADVGFSLRMVDVDKGEGTFYVK